MVQVACPKHITTGPWGCATCGNKGWIAAAETAQEAALTGLSKLPNLQHNGLFELTQRQIEETHKQVAAHGREMRELLESHHGEEAALNDVSRIGLAEAKCPKGVTRDFRAGYAAGLSAVRTALKVLKVAKHR